MPKKRPKNGAQFIIYDLGGNAIPRELIDEVSKFIESKVKEVPTLAQMVVNE